VITEVKGKTNRWKRTVNKRDIYDFMLFFIVGIDEVTAFGKSPQTVKARSLLCFWAHRKLGMTTIEIGKKLNLSQSAVSRSSIRGEKIARENRFELIERNA